MLNKSENENAKLNIVPGCRAEVRKFPYLDPCWSCENSTMWWVRSRNCRFGSLLFLKSSRSLLLPVDLSRLRGTVRFGNRVLVELLKMLLDEGSDPFLCMYLASAPGAAEIMRQPFEERTPVEKKDANLTESKALEK